MLAGGLALNRGLISAKLARGPGEEFWSLLYGWLVLALFIATQMLGGWIVRSSWDTSILLPWEKFRSLLLFGSLFAALTLCIWIFRSKLLFALGH